MVDVFAKARWLQRENAVIFVIRRPAKDLLKLFWLTYIRSFLIRFCKRSVNHMQNNNNYQTEPSIRVGIMAAEEIHFVLKGSFMCGNQLCHEGSYSAQARSGQVYCFGKKFDGMARLEPVGTNATFILKKVTIGIGFHWEQQEDQEFEGVLVLQVEVGLLRAVNEVLLEHYLTSVISSEMSAMNDQNLLMAHAIVSRSWLLAQINRKDLIVEIQKGDVSIPQNELFRNEIVRWYDREDHVGFEVCADDHCQRYQGITKVVSPKASAATVATRGLVLTYNNEICDARFSKCCGGISEDFENVWQPVKVPYLVAVRDLKAGEGFESGMPERFITSAPESFCNTSDPEILCQVLIDFDRTTTNFFRWTVGYEQDQLAELIARKSGIDFGAILNLEPIERGRSGRIIRLKIVGEKQSVIVGKELEIRKWLSESHLYSSAFVVEKVFENRQDLPSKFLLHGAGWGHGVGMCQIGAAVMSRRGFSPQQILKHYFSGAKIDKLYP